MLRFLPGAAPGVRFVSRLRIGRKTRGGMRDDAAWQLPVGLEAYRPRSSLRPFQNAQHALLSDLPSLAGAGMKGEHYTRPRLLSIG